MNSLFPEYKITGVKKFYFLEYFYILLKSVESGTSNEEIFSFFKSLKNLNQLGESKYRKLKLMSEPITERKLARYEYTFNQVIEEALIYDLIKKSNETYALTKSGEDLLDSFKSDKNKFNLKILELMESNLFGFHYLINTCIEANRSKNGLLIFPIYSPLKLNITKNSINKSSDIVAYINILVNKLQSDSYEHLERFLDLNQAKNQLINKLISNNLINLTSESFNETKYYAVLSQIRNFWLNYFLNEVYKIKMSVSYFEIWCYRAMQLGILNVTEFYYNFEGKIIYPISIISNKVNNKDFIQVFKYNDGKSLYLHSPEFPNIKEQFTKVVYESYIDLKSKLKSYFINLYDLREIVCYKLKISFDDFAHYFELLYQLNLEGQISLQISLEADKTPEETKAMYLKREPIYIDNRLINIIAINLKK